MIGACTGSIHAAIVFICSSNSRHSAMSVCVDMSSVRAMTQDLFGTSSVQCRHNTYVVCNIPHVACCSSTSVPGSPGAIYNSDVTSRHHAADDGAPADDADLLSRLTDVAAAEASAAERRQRFRCSRDSWRRRTQPVTPDEIQQASRCES